MNVVDSSGWLEYFADGPNAERFGTAIEATEGLIVPTVSVLEVYRKTLRERGERAAYAAAGAMRSGNLVSLDEGIAISAARLGVEHRLALADSVILATARRFGATLWTQDADFEALEGVRYIPR